MSTPVTLVTGGAQGIGLGITRHLLAGGHRVAIADIDRQALDEAVTTLASDHLLGTVCNVADNQQVATWLAAVMEHWGRIDGVVNNACRRGHWAGGPPEQQDLALWHATLAVNLTAPYLVTRRALPQLRQAHGAVVNIASTRALQSEPYGEAYAASKGGLIALTHALAISCGPDVRVNAIAPGWIETGDHQRSDLRQVPDHRPIDHQQHPCGRIGTPHDIAALVAFLLDHDRSGFITGQTIVCDGGMTKRMYYAP